jgi:hypothetical protein
MGANMTDPKTRLTRHNGKWHILARNTANGVTGAAWMSLGGCDCQLTAVRVWLACLKVDKR